jgi:hypothetical protein
MLTCETPRRAWPHVLILSMWPTYAPLAMGLACQRCGEDYQDSPDSSYCLGCRWIMQQYASRAVLS